MVLFGNRWLQLVGSLLLWMTFALPAWAEIQVIDDADNTITLEQPARRIVSLAPHITELLFAIGAGDLIVGTAEFSNFPAAAARIPRISGGAGLDLEAIIALQPDLVIAWQSGNPAAQVKRLYEFGLTVFMSEPRQLQDVAGNMTRLGQLTGTQPVAAEQVRIFNERLASLQQRYAVREQVSVFYQVWDKPLMTVNGVHLVSDVMRLCGGDNVFSGLSILAPQISMEAVVSVDPDVIIANEVAGSDSLDIWHDWSGMQAVKHGHLYSIPAELLVRHTPRILEGAQRLCEILEEVRKPDS